MDYTRKLRYILLIFLCLVAVDSTAQVRKFKVALDAGHGGKDFGATHNYYVEKNIALNVTLKVGKILEGSSGVEVIYTRKSDVFVDVLERANIANRADADIFVSLHCNSNDNTDAFGTETYVMGKPKNASNSEAAKRENAVILMEKDYRDKYDGLEPNSSESMAALHLPTDEFLENSIALAGKIENQFTDNLKKRSRGVKMAPYIVLHKTFMPRVLVELGFISNPKEGAFLDSEDGQQQMAEAIAKAIISYKKEVFGTASAEPAVKPSSKIVSRTEPEVRNLTPVSSEINTQQPFSAKGVIFRVQISASGKKLETTPANFKGLNNISVTTEGGSLFKYMYGETDNYEMAKRNLAEAKSKGFDTAYIVAYRDGVKIKLQEALP